MTFRHFISLTGLGFAGGGALFLIAFVFYSMAEGERRATFIALFGLMFWCAGVLAVMSLAGPFRNWLVLGIEIFVLIGVFVLLPPWNRITTLQITGSQARIDERDAIFHRFLRLKPGTAEFRRFYADHPRKKRIDDKIRRSPELGSSESAAYHPLNSLYQIAEFDVMERISRELEWEPSGEPVQGEPAEFTKRIKGFARFLGADLVGTTSLNPAYIYSHIGRSPGKWGSSIKLDHPNAIAIACEMNYRMIRHAPGLPVTTETAYQYYEVGKVAMMVARYINFLGYEARAHVDGNYRLLCVPVAADAGLGELGRLGLLITPEFGPRIRLSVVTTNMPLIQDRPLTFGVQEFCRICKKCADNCPSGSIMRGEKTHVCGVEKWQSQQESCFAYWRHQGTDCSLCIRVCPYAHPDNIMHNIVRLAIRRNSAARRLALLADDVVYGRKPRGVYRLPEWHRD